MLHTRLELPTAHVVAKSTCEVDKVQHAGAASTGCWLQSDRQYRMAAAAVLIERGACCGTGRGSLLLATYEELVASFEFNAQMPAAQCKAATTHLQYAEDLRLGADNSPHAAGDAVGACDRSHFDATCCCCYCMHVL